MIISRYLKASSDLAAVTQHAERLLALQQLFEVIAPPALAQYCRVANFKQGKLVLHAANALIAAKLRQVVPSLSDEFSNRGWKVTAIQVAVQQWGDEPQKPPQVAPLPPAARARLAAFARSAADPKLRDAVEHLLEAAKPGTANENHDEPGD
jgi:hypothetical protein